MKFWQSLAWCETDQIVEIAKFAEELGFEGVLMADHVFFPRDHKGLYPYSEDGKHSPIEVDTPYPDPWVAAAAMAQATSRLKFATMVYVMPLRHPAVVAKSVASASVLSGGRVILGVSAGWMADEFDALGIPFEERGPRLDEGLEIVQKFWSGDWASHDGKYYQFEEATTAPQPTAKVPIYIGGASAPAIRRAAKYDGWMGAGNTLEEAEEILRTIGSMRQENGKSGEPFDAMVPLLASPSVDDYKRLSELGLTSIPHTPFRYVFGDRSSIDDKKRLMETFAKEAISPLSAI